MALLKAGPVASIQIFTAQVFHFSNITCPFIHPQQALLKGTFSVGLSARDWCLRYWSNGGSFLSFCSFLSSQGRNRTARCTWWVVCCPRQWLCMLREWRVRHAISISSWRKWLRWHQVYSFSVLVFSFFCFNFVYFKTPSTSNFLLTW